MKETALEQFFTEGNELNAAFTQSVVFDVDDGYKKSLPAHIIANFDEVKAAIIAGTQKDRGVVVTPETIDAAKSRCALLNKQIEMIEAERKEVKKNWNKPYTEFEKRCKELVEIITTAKDAQWEQVKAFEERAKEEKRAELVIIHDKYVPAIVKALFTFDEILDPKWLNKGTPLKTAETQLLEKLDQLSNDLSTLQSMGGEFTAVGFQAYKATRSLSAALGAIEKAKELAKLAPAPAQTVVQHAQAPEENEETICIDFRVYATKTQLNALKAYLSQSGIKYGRVPREEK
jgi:hypothetical protein